MMRVSPKCWQTSHLSRAQQAYTLPGERKWAPPKKLKALDHASLACADDLLAAALEEFADAEEDVPLQAPPKEQVPLQTPPKKGKPCTKPVAMSADKSAGNWASPVWGKLCLTQASRQSYIQFCNKDTGKKALLVSLTANAFPKLASWVRAQKDISKEGVLQQRAHMAQGNERGTEPCLELGQASSWVCKSNII